MIVNYTSLLLQSTPEVYHTRESYHKRLEKSAPEKINEFQLGFTVMTARKKIPSDGEALLWSQNFLFRLRLSKSFGSGAGSGSDISFVSTFYHRFHIKKWIFHVFL